MSTPLRTGKCESSAVEWASAPSATKYGQAAHNARHMIEWGQYPFNNKETLKQGNKGFAWRHRTPATGHSRNMEGDLLGTVTSQQFRTLSIDTMFNDCG